jgi:hypothetical protein
MREHSEYDFSGGVRGKYTAQYESGTNVVLLEPDVAEAFPNAMSVNEALRGLLAIVTPRETKGAGNIRSFFAYTGVMPARSCVVSFADTNRVRHSVEVTAESLYEAVILAIAEFRRCDLMDHAAPGPGTTIAVEVKSASTRHEVPLGHVRDWLNGVTKSPKERATKERLRALIEG